MKALDLFCCAGGASRGLQQAGYHVTGVDIRPQPRCAGDVFRQDDAMAWLRGERETLSSFDLIWASPPCELYSELTPTAHRGAHPDLLPEVLAILRRQSKPFIVENVAGARQHFRDAIVLCGSMFGLPIQRHRWFEVGNTDAFFLLPPCNHSEPPVLVSGRGMRKVDGVRWSGSRMPEMRAAMEIDWMIREELRDAIPPAYARFLAGQVRP
jgi:DNA (cytosine-5)-methyltransferase 1